MPEDTVELGNQGLLYNAFHVVKTLGHGGMGQVLLVRADRGKAGFAEFLGSAIAWQEVFNHKQLAPLRLQIMGLNEKIRKLSDRLREQLDDGHASRIQELKDEVVLCVSELDAMVESLKTNQDFYVRERGRKLTAADDDAMIGHLTRLGLTYPDDDLFAMKRVLVREEVFLARIQDEFKSIKLVQHKNILKVYALGPDYYIMEHLSDIVPADDIIAHASPAGGRYTDADRVRILIQAAAAVEHAHVFNVIHRDIKPDNIAVDRQGRVKLIDFGLVKSLETENMTQSGVTLGTPHFMCKEQIENTRQILKTFDVYALGASLYFYLAGEMPYKRARNRTTGAFVEPRSVHEILSMVCNREIEPYPLAAIRPAMPPVLESIVKKAMAKTADERYGSVRELREDLEEYMRMAGREALAGAIPADPSDGRAITSSEDPTATIRTGRRKLVLLFMVIIFVVTVTGIYAWYRSRGMTPADMYQAARRNAERITASIASGPLDTAGRAVAGLIAEGRYREAEAAVAGYLADEAYARWPDELAAMRRTVTAGIDMDFALRQYFVDHIGQTVAIALKNGTTAAGLVEAVIHRDIILAEPPPAVTGSRTHVDLALIAAVFKRECIRPDAADIDAAAALYIEATAQGDAALAAELAPAVKDHPLAMYAEAKK